MASLFLLLLLLTTLTLTFSPPQSAANLHATTAIFRSQPSASVSASHPTTFFEVTKPIPLPKTIPCSQSILRHDFADTYGKPPITAHYKPPSGCPSQNFDAIVLEWNATSRGHQFDRIFGIWLGGVEILRSCTAEPRAAGIFWTVRKDITRYHSLLMTPNQILTVHLSNRIDHTFNAVYHVNLTFHFYPSEKSERQLQNEPADLILPISRNLPLNDGLWFQIQNSTDVQSKEFQIPRNAFRAVLEVYVSFHETDEFWYQNFPNEYISGNNLTDAPGNGAFREVVVGLDDNFTVGVVWPFTVIYTGGINPLLWRPITGIASFDLLSYDIELTPLLGVILDGKPHRLSFAVTNALNVWFVDANLHLWLDHHSEKTEGEVLNHLELPPSSYLDLNFTGFDGSFVTKVNRSIDSIGMVRSSRGNITTRSIQGFDYSNRMVMGNDGDLQVLNQNINLRSSTRCSSGGSINTHQAFSLYIRSEAIDRGDGTYNSVANVSLGLITEIKRQKGRSGVGIVKSKLRNLQNANGDMVVNGSLVSGGLGSTRQEYQFMSDVEPCYFKNVSSWNYTVIHNEERNAC